MAGLRQALSSAPGSFFLASLISLFLGNSPAALLESTKLLAPGSLQLEIYHLLSETNQKNPEERISQMFWFGFPAFGQSILQQTPNLGT